MSTIRHELIRVGRDVGIQKIVDEFSVRQFILRCPVEGSSSREDIVEIAALVIVEAEVDKRVTPCGLRVDKTYLVETDISAIYERRLGSILLYDQSCRERSHRMSEESYASRVGRNGRYVGTQSIECSTHTHITCSTVEVGGDYFAILIGFLSPCRCYGQ